MISAVEEMERLFLALSDKTRIRLIGLMSDREVSVNYLCDALDDSQPKVSRHLAYLRSARVVSTRREGKWIYYSLVWPTDPAGKKCFDDILDWIMPERSRRRPIEQVSDAGAEEKPYEFGGVSDGHIYEEPNMFDRERQDMEIHLL